MRIFKYLLFFFIFISNTSNADEILDSFGKYEWTHSNISGQKFKTAEQACKAFIPILKPSYPNSNPTFVRLNKLNGNQYQCVIKINDSINHGSIVSYAIPTSPLCPSAQARTLKVAVNAPTYTCVENCQYRLTSCVDVDFEPGMTCGAISTGTLCGSASNSGFDANGNKPKSPDSGGNPPITSGGANQNNDGSNTPTNSANTTTNSTTTYDETNNTWNTTTNSKTTIDTSSLENTVTNGFDKLIEKFKCLTTGDCPKDGGDGDGDGDGIGDNPFGTDPIPEQQISEQSFQTNLFYSNDTCPIDRTLSMNFLGRSFSYTFSFSELCGGLALLGNIVLIMAYLFGAYIIVSKS